MWLPLWPRAPEHRFGAREELEYSDRFYDVVIRATAKALYLINFRIARREDEHRRISTIRAVPTQDLEAVHLWQHQVEDDKVRAVRCEPFQCGLSAVSYTHLRAHETGRNLVC